ncbi:MAG: cupin domain-containing protein [Candidatus Zixiibacteriota bacterium]|nr:MAG: cupin domain-containing protein [candidate division Zixibacteria bacterium]
MTSQKGKAVTLDPAVVYRLDNLLEYADESIVSRTVLKSEVGTITLFSFDAGQELSEHTTPYDAMVQVLDGEAELTIGGKTVVPKAGETVIMPADVPHAVRAVKRFKMLLTMIRG